MSEFWKDEHTKMLIDLFDENVGPTEAGFKLGFTRNAVIGQRNRHGYSQGHGLIVELAKSFPDATALEIAEATARDKAPDVLRAIGDERELGGAIRKSVVAAMRASLREGSKA